MDVPYTTIFVGLLVVYLVYSVWAQLDGRYPIVAALILLVVTAVVDATGNVDAANSLAEYVFFLLAGGVVLLVVEQVRSRPTAAATKPSGSVTTEGGASQTTQEREGPTDQPLDGLEKKAVPLIDRARREDQPHEEDGDREPEGG
jgi:hypothetical protein